MIKELFGDDYKELVNNQDLLEKSLAIVEKAFEDITDKEGKPYIEHLIRVSNRLSSIEGKVVGLLHDIIEDTETTFDDLRELGYPNHIIEAVELLTKRNPNDHHEERVERLLNSGNLLAITVKKADIEDNMDENRLKELEIIDPQTAKRLRNKYAKGYHLIAEYLKKEGDKYVRY